MLAVLASPRRAHRLARPSSIFTMRNSAWANGRPGQLVNGFRRVGRFIFVRQVCGVGFAGRGHDLKPLAQSGGEIFDAGAKDAGCAKYAH